MSYTTASSSGGMPHKPTHRSGRVKSLAFRIGRPDVKLSKALAMHLVKVLEANLGDPHQCLKDICMCLTASMTLERLP